jgi:chemotaxis protein CheD
MPDKVLHVGEVFASRAPIRICTTLGSCIAVCLFDPFARVGGMNHFLLPEGSQDKELPARYGVYAMDLLITDIMNLGGERQRLEAKVFGGGHVLPWSERALSVPEANIQFVKQFLAAEQIPLRGLRVGGNCPLRVHFYPHTGQAFVKQLSAKYIRAVTAAEVSYQVEMVNRMTSPRKGQVTLF